VSGENERRTPRGLALLYRDPCLVAFDKPAGLLTIPGREGGEEHLLGQGFRLLASAGSAPKKLFTVHRLDRLTSGLVLFALDPTSHRLLCIQFERREVEKRYLALVHPAPAVQEGTLVANLVPARRGFMRRSHPGERGVEAVTGYRVVDPEGSEGALLELTPQTGRTHQIRLQLADLGSPIVGEPHYRSTGGVKAREAHRLWLHGWRLGFRHPATGAWTTLESPPPEELGVPSAQAAPVRPVASAVRDER
jgi:tRNA pseudouridine32 synthase/23S rRNA pseudouridine746 synthase